MKFIEKSSCFEGWYFKQQKEDYIIAFIGAYHKNNRGEERASLQVIENNASYFFDYSITEFQQKKAPLEIRIGKNFLSERGCILNLQEKGLRLKGSLCYEGLTYPDFNIMGPFRFLPMLECRHHLLSIHHQVSGILTVNEKTIDFQGGNGYIEGDKGRSFPKRYVWSHWCDRENAIMVSVADIPWMFFTFPGCIAAVYYRKKTYYLATYHGAKIIKFGRNTLIIKQKDLLLEVYLLAGQSLPLLAPENGEMRRLTHESCASVVRYRFSIGSKVLFDFVSKRGSFEACGL